MFPYKEVSTIYNALFINYGKYTVKNFRLRELDVKALPIALIENAELYVWISEEGKFYVLRGQIADDIEEMWQYVLTEEGCIRGWKRV